MTQVLIIADDLSGAADCAGAFFKAGLETLVVMEREAGQSACADAAQVLAIDADTRRLLGAEAARIQFDLFNRYRSPGQLLYKKIDSTLRGNFAQELGAIIQQAGLAIVAPAFPQAGRSTRDGHQYLGDTPLAATEIWRSEGGAAHIPGMLARHGIRAASIRMAEIRQGVQRVGGLLAACARDGMQAVVCDAEADTDLRIIAAASISLPLPRFWVGSAGLAGHLAAAAQIPARPALPVRIHTQGSILTVVGSLSSVSRAQAEYLCAAGSVGRLEVPASLLRQAQAHPRRGELSGTLEMSLQNDRDLLITIGTESRADLGAEPQLCQALAALVAPLAGYLGAAVLTGGETARAVLRALGATGLRLAGEIEPGVPLSVAAGIRPIPVITKAGAYGSRETLMRCYRALRQARGVSSSAANSGWPNAGSETAHGKTS